MPVRTSNILLRTSGWLLITLLLAACGPSGPKQSHHSRQLLGTRFELSLTAPDNQRMEKATEAAYREMNRVASLLDHNNPDSPVSAINRAAGQQPVAIPPELMEMLVRAEAVSKRTQGAFDITLGALQGWSFDRKDLRKPADADIAAQRPLINYRDLRLDARKGTAFLARRGMRIQLDGIARLEVMQAGLRVLREHGIDYALINADGDVAALGNNQQEPWRVGIRDPRAPHEMLGVIDIESGFLLSSGDMQSFFMKDGKRYHHIIDPRTGYPTEGVRGVTLTGRDLAAINGVSAAIMAMGLPAGRALIERTPGLDGLIVDGDGTLWVSAGLKPRLRLGRPLPGDRN